MSRDFTLDFGSKKVLLSRGFAKLASKQGTPEYYRYIEYKKLYADFTFDVREYNAKTSQRRYKGMNYDFMRIYIQRHETEANAKLMLEKLETLLLDMEGVSKDHCYPRIKHWFLLNYPELKKAGSFAEIRQQIDGEIQLASIDAVA